MDVRKREQIKFEGKKRLCTSENGMSDIPTPEELRDFIENSAKLDIIAKHYGTEIFKQKERA